MSLCVDPICRKMVLNPSKTVFTWRTHVEWTFWSREHKSAKQLCTSCRCPARPHAGPSPPQEAWMEIRYRGSNRKVSLPLLPKPTKFGKDWLTLKPTIGRGDRSRVVRGKAGPSWGHCRVPHWWADCAAASAVGWTGYSRWKGWGWSVVLLMLWHAETGWNIISSCCKRQTQFPSVYIGYSQLNKIT